MNDFLATLEPWYRSIGAMTFFTAVRYMYRHFLLEFLKRLYEKKSIFYLEDIVNAFQTPINIMLFVAGFYFFMNMAPLAELNNLPFVEHLLRSTIVLSFFWGVYNLSDTTHGIMLDLVEKLGIRSEETVSNIFATILRILIVVIAFVAIAKEWSYDISAFIASLSIGSVAIAFAAKDALANVFGSLIIILDKPFKVGDWILANGIEGTVEKVSFRSTCVRTFPQELVYIPNSLLSNTPITNFTRRYKRRLDFTLGVTYSTTREQMEQLIEDIRGYFIAHPRFHHDDIRVHFTGYGASSLDIRIVCYAATGDHTEYLNILNQVNLSMLDILKQNGVSCAFPSTSVYFENKLETEAPASPFKEE